MEPNIIIRSKLKDTESGIIPASLKARYVQKFLQSDLSLNYYTLYGDHDSNL